MVIKPPILESPVMMHALRVPVLRGPKGLDEEGKLGVIWHLVGIEEA
jgi:hypothetical protein